MSLIDIKSRVGQNAIDIVIPKKQESEKFVSYIKQFLLSVWRKDFVLNILQLPYLHYEWYQKKIMVDCVF